VSLAKALGNLALGRLALDSWIPKALAPLGIPEMRRIHDEIWAFLQKIQLVK